MPSWSGSEAPVWLQLNSGLWEIRGETSKHLFYRIIISIRFNFIYTAPVTIKTVARETQSPNKQQCQEKPPFNGRKDDQTDVGDPTADGGGEGQIIEEETHIIDVNKSVILKVQSGNAEKNLGFGSFYMFRERKP